LRAHLQIGSPEAAKIPGAVVAQICNLLFRRIVSCWATDCPSTPKSLRPADCKSAIRQIENLRYEVAQFPNVPAVTRFHCFLLLN
jgi:hypothetical protein